mgnify:CR=1 FL=1
MDEDYKQSDISKEVERLMDEEGFEFGEAVKEAMSKGYKDGGLMIAIQKLAQGGMTYGDKTYHQYHDQFVPPDTENMMYANGGGVGSMMQPRQNFAVGGGADYFQPLGYDEDESITVEDLTVPSRVGDFRVSAAKPLDDQSGLISAATNIMSPGVNTIEGSLINDDYPNDPIRSMTPATGRFSEFDKARMGAPANTSYGYQDMIMNPEGFPNALQNLERFQDNRFEDLDFQPGFNFKDAPNKVTNLKELYENREYLNNPNKGIIDNMILSRGNPEKSLFNKTKNMFSNVKDGITSIDLPGKFKEGAKLAFTPLMMAANARNPLNTNAANYNPNLANQLNFADSMGMIVTDPNSNLDKFSHNLISRFLIKSLSSSNSEFILNISEPSILLEELG